jgi:cob(I)alamin adenosyltransferase
MIQSLEWSVVLMFCIVLTCIYINRVSRLFEKIVVDERHRMYVRFRQRGSKYVRVALSPYRFVLPGFLCCSVTYNKKTLPIFIISGSCSQDSRVHFARYLIWSKERVDGD